MNKKLGTLYLLAAIMLTPATSRSAAPAPSTVIVFGDSITEGNELPPADRTHRWTDLVQAASQGRLHIINQGKGGRPTASLADFTQMLAHQPRPGILVIALGTNDSRNIHDDCVPAAVKNISAMVTLAREAYGQPLPILIIAPPNIRKDALGPTRPIADQRDARLRQLGDAYQTLATGLHCHYLSLYGIIPAESLAKDGVHPDPAGNQAIATAVLPQLLDIAKSSKAE